MGWSHDEDERELAEQDICLRHADLMWELPAEALSAYTPAPELYDPLGLSREPREEARARALQVEPAPMLAPPAALVEVAPVEPTFAPEVARWTPPAVIIMAPIWVRALPPPLPPALAPPPMVVAPAPRVEAQEEEGLEELSWRDLEEVIEQVWAGELSAWTPLEVVAQTSAEVEPAQVWPPDEPVAWGDWEGWHEDLTPEREVSLIEVADEPAPASALWTDVDAAWMADLLAAPLEDEEDEEAQEQPSALLREREREGDSARRLALGLAMTFALSRRERVALEGLLLGFVNEALVARRLAQLLDQGVEVEAILVAHEVREQWLERAFHQEEPRRIDWVTALALIDAFDSVPDEEEVLQVLEVLERAWIEALRHEQQTCRRHGSAEELDWALGGRRGRRRGMLFWDFLRAHLRDSSPEVAPLTAAMTRLGRPDALMALWLETLWDARPDEATRFDLDARMIVWSQEV